MRDEEGHLPPGTSTLTPYICPRDAATAIDWYCDVLGAVEDGPRYVDPSGRIGHAQVTYTGRS